MDFFCWVIDFCNCEVFGGDKIVLLLELVGCKIVGVVKILFVL